MDFGVYFQISNRLPVPLHFARFESSNGDCAVYDGPQLIPNDGAPRTVHVRDPCRGQGAEGTAYFIADIGGVVRQYAWHGNCPMWSSTNDASGPGVSMLNRTGHPLTVDIAVDAATPGWTAASRLIQHVFVLMLENRSFDHMLGYSGITGTDAESGKPTTIVGLQGTESNSWNGASYAVSEGADWIMPLDRATSSPTSSPSWPAPAPPTRRAGRTPRSATPASSPTTWARAGRGARARS